MPDMNNGDTFFKYEKVYLFVTYKINEDSGNRFWKTESRDWDFYAYDKDRYFNDNKVHLFIEFWNSQEDKSLEQTVEKAFEVKGMQKLSFDKLVRYEKNGTLDLSKESRESKELKKMLVGISYPKIERCFRNFVDLKYGNYIENDDTFKSWKEIYYIDDRKKSRVTCALNDYEREEYKDKFIDYIYYRLPRLFPADKYYIFIHGRFLIKDDGNPCIETKKVEGNRFYIKTFHHTLFYAEYKFLITQGDFDYLYLELLFDKTVRNLLKEVGKCIISILADPEFVDDECIQTLVSKLLLLKSNENMVSDSLFILTESVGDIHKGPELVNLLNKVVAESQLIRIK